ncbi:MAG: bifunctional 3-deoxy-7-phosphoheptulonate synthase/chorismate mutase type II [Bacteroidales bacterium]|nr:bifunctional 3-deoxy-7-phosphoheptulonate synthase/chorismate mutase type II [Bacteroidales bacterium]
MKFDSFSSYIQRYQKGLPLLIAGPCSAESESQVLSIAEQLTKNEKVHVFRAGIWKPRTRPGNFEGVGYEGLKWLKRVKAEYKLQICTEVAKPKHVEAALKEGIDILWLGARTVSNPFSVQEIADSLKGVDIPVFIKNPINPDIHLWRGAIERMSHSGVTKIAAIHRGFYPYEDTKFRNIPKWEIPIELKTKFQHLPMICDPSHISGNRDFIEEIAQKALDLNFDGLMVETHHTPDLALSDAEQQITPEQLAQIIRKLVIRHDEIDKKSSVIFNYREQIDSIDQQLMELLSQRMDVVKKIAFYKSEQNITIFQLRRWENIIRTRSEWGKKLKLNAHFIEKILELMHKESIQIQNDIMNQTKEK